MEFRKEPHFGGLYGYLTIGKRRYPVWTFSSEETFDPMNGSLRQFVCEEDDFEGWVIPEFSVEEENKWKSIGGKIFRKWNGRYTFWWKEE